FDGVLQFQNLALHIDRDVLGQVAVGVRGCNFSDVSYLTSQIAGHRVHIVSEVLPRSGHTTHVSLAAEFSFRTYFTRHARNFRSERVQLVHHRVDGVLQFEDLALHVYSDLLGQVTIGDRGRHLSDVTNLARKIAGH